MEGFGLRALCLFEMAFSLARMIPGDNRSSPVAMAALNNSAFIHHALGNYHLSRYCLDMLTGYILGLPPSNDSRTQKERYEYLLNAVLLQEPSIAPAA